MVFFPAPFFFFFCYTAFSNVRPYLTRSAGREDNFHSEACRNGHPFSNPKSVLVRSVTEQPFVEHQCVINISSPLLHIRFSLFIILDTTSPCFKNLKRVVIWRLSVVSPPWRHFGNLLHRSFAFSASPLYSLPRTSRRLHPRHLSEKQLCEEMKTVQFLDIGGVDCDELDGESNEKVVGLLFFDETTDPTKLTNTSVTIPTPRRPAGGSPTTSPGSNARF